jgi:uncharacterized protein
MIISDRLGSMVPIMSHSPGQWIAENGMILRVLVGSGVHGTSIDGQDDRDEMGICVEPPDTVIGLSRFEHYQYRTQPEGHPSGAGDLDLIVYSLRKFAGLAAKGNPTVLLPLFVPDKYVCYSTDIGRELREKRSLFISKQAGLRFRGYLESQRKGLMGLRSGGTRNQGRADIRAKYGFDTKFAMHMVRLGLQGVELLTTGNITLPVPEPHLTWLRELRQAKHSKEAALAYAERLERKIETLTQTSSLPETPDCAAIDRWLVQAHYRHWKLET